MDKSLFKRPSPAQLNTALFGVLWTIFSWIFVNFIVLPAIIFGLAKLGLPIAVWVREGGTITAIILGFAYAPLTFLLIWLGFKLYKKSTVKLMSLIGLLRKPTISDVGYALGAFCIYFLISSAVFVIIGMLISPDLLNQKQELGIATPNSVWMYLLTFLMLVILPPIIEELLFRGALFGSARKGFSFIVSALFTSLLFGLAHGQFNLFVDTFILSMFLCYLRFKTDSLWASIFLHMTKNLLAFLVLYVFKINLG